MNQSKISVRYAKAFFSLAKEKGLLDTFKEDMEVVANAGIESKDFLLLLESPVVKTSQKVKILNQIFSGKIHDLTLKFILLIAENKREIHIPDICRNFLALTREDLGIKSAMITSAKQLSKESMEQAKEILEKNLNYQIEITEKVDPAIIGGVILRVDDKQVDASIATQLKKIKSKLLETEIKQ